VKRYLQLTTASMPRRRNERDAKGEIACQLTVIKLRLLLAALLAAGALLFSSQHPESLKDVGIIIGPIIATLLSSAAFPSTRQNVRKR
jgi:hypothetical protein